MDSSPLSLLKTRIPTSSANSNPIPASSTNRKPRKQSKSSRVTAKSVQYKGVWLKSTRNKKREKKEEKGRYATEIAHHTIEGPRHKIWLGTYDTPGEAALAYDLASVMIKRRSPNNFIGENGEIRAPVSLERQESMEREVKKLVEGKFKGDSNQVGETSAGRKKKKVQEVEPGSNEAEV